MRGFGLILDADKKRALTPRDFDRARIGELHRDVSLDKVPDKAPYKKHVTWYLEKLDQNIENGIGLILTGDHGSGKSASAVIVCNETMARGGSALFVEENDLIGLVINNEMFKDDTSFLDRAKEVDVLVIDDLGLSPQSENLHITETLVKYRLHRNRVTIITTNLKKKDYADRYKTICDSLTEKSLPVVCDGVAWREALNKELVNRFRRESDKT